MPDNKSINLGDLNVTPKKQKTDSTFDYYKQGSNVSGTDSVYFPKEDQSILLTQDDVDNIKALNQSTVSKLSSDLVAATAKTASGLVRDAGMIIGGLNYLSNAINTGKEATYEDFKNPLTESAEEFDKWIDEALPHYLSTDEKDNPTAYRNLFSSAFFGKTLLREAVPFAATAYLEGMGLGKLAGTTTKAAMANRLSKLGGEFSEQGMKLAKKLNWGNKQVIGSLVNFNEAAFESLNTSDRVYDITYNNLLKDGVTEDIAKQKAKEAADNAFENSFLINFAVLRATDYQFDGLFKSTLNSRRGSKEVLKELSNTERTSSFLKDLGKNMLSESAQELTQGAVSSTLEKAASEGKTLSTIDTFGQALKSLPERVTTDEGIIEILSSAFISAGFTGANKVFGFKDERNQRSFVKDQYEKSIAGTTTLKPEDIINTKNEITEKGKELLNNLSNFAELEVVKTAAISKGNLDLYQKAFDIQLSNMAYGHFEAGIGEEFERKLRSQVDTLKADLQKTGKSTITDYETGKQVTPEEYIQKTITKAKNFESIYNSLQDQFDIAEPSLRKTLFLNAVQQTEVRKKLDSTPKAIGQDFISYVSEDSELASMPLNEAYNKVLEKRNNTTDVTEKAKLQVLVDDYLNYSRLAVEGDFQSKAINDKNLSQNIFNKKYYTFLKQNFDLLVNPDSKARKEVEKLFKNATKQEGKIVADLIAEEEIKEVPKKTKQPEVSDLTSKDIEEPEDMQDMQDLIEALNKKEKTTESPFGEVVSPTEEELVQPEEDIEETVDKSTEQVTTKPSVNPIEGTVYEGDLADTGIKVAFLSKTWAIENTETSVRRKDLGTILEQFINNSNPKSFNTGDKLVVRKEPAIEKYEYKIVGENYEYVLDENKQPKKRKALPDEFDLKIYDENNNYVGNIHEPEWLLLTKKGAYINTTEENRLADFHILKDIWNSFDKPKVVTVISKGPGRVNTERIDNKPVYKPLKQAVGTFISNRIKDIKDKFKPLIGVAKGAVVGFGNSNYVPSDNNAVNEQSYPDGSIVLLAEAANGQDIILPLNLNNLGDSADVVTKMLRLIRIFNKKDLANISGLGIKSINGSSIKSYLSNLVYFTDYTDKNFGAVSSKNPIKLALKTEGDLVSIKAAYVTSEGKVKFNEIKDFKNAEIELVDSFLKEINTALKSRFYNVNSSSLGLFNTKFFLPKFEGNRLSGVNEFSNYEDFLSTNVVTTDIREFGNGYLFLQPVIKFDPLSLLDPTTEKKEVEPTPVETVETEEINIQEEEFIFPEETDYNINNTDLFDDNNYSLDSLGLEPDKVEYLSSIIEKEFIKDSEGNKLNSLDKQNILKNVILYQAVNRLRKGEKPSVVFKAALDRLNNNLKTITIFKSINDSNYEKAKASSTAPALLKNSESYKDFNLKRNDVLAAENELRFVTKPEVFSQFVDKVKQEVKNKFKVDVSLDNSILEENLIPEENINPDTDDSVERSDNEIGDKEKRSAQADSSEVNPRKHLSWKMKMFLSDIPMEVTYNYLPLYYDYNVVYTKVLDILSNPTDSSLEYIVEKLVGSNNYIAQQVGKKLLNETDSTVINQFITATLLEKSDYLAEEIKVVSTANSFFVKAKAFFSNRNDTINSVLDELSENLKSSKIALNKNGEYFINKEVATDLYKKYQKALEGTILDKHSFLTYLFDITNNRYLNNNLRAILTTDNGLLGYFKKSDPYKTASDIFKKKGLIGLIVNNLTKNIETTEDIKLSSNNPFAGESREGSTQILAKMISDANNVSGATVFKNMEGKSFYSFNLRSFLSNTYYKLSNSATEASVKLNNAFSSTSRYLKALAANQPVLKGLFYFDGSSYGKSDYEKYRRTAQDDNQQILAYMLEFSEGRFFLPTLSDKTKSPLISIKQSPEDKFTIKEVDGRIEFDAYTIDRIKNIINAEAKRIKEFQIYKNKFLETGTVEQLQKELGDYAIAAERFFLFSDLNGKYESIDIDQYIQDKLNETINYTKKFFEEKGFGEYYIPKNIKDQYSSTTEFIANMTVSYMEFLANYQQMVSGDPALFWKKSIEGTLEEYTKRLAKDIAPGIEGNWLSKQYSSVFIKSLKVDIAENNKYINKLFGKNNYVADTTDAQEFTTLKEHLEVMYAFGKELDKPKYLDFINRLTNNPEEEFTESELKEILSDEVLLANKPVQVYSAPRTTKDGLYTWNNIYYIKSSSIPLIPQYTKGTPLDTVRVAMEKANINRLAFDSAVKAGKSQVIDLFNSKNELNFNEETLIEEFKNNQHILNRTGFKIQQELPYKKDKFAITVVSQMNKLIFDNIADITFSLNDKTFTGVELKELKETVRKTLFNLAYEDLKDELGLIVTEDTVQIKDMSKLVSALKKEAESRDYPTNDIESLALDTNGELIIPLAYNNSFSKFESLIASLFSKIVLQKQPGKSYVQTSAVGMKYLNEVPKNTIVFTEIFEPSKGLQYIDENKPYAEVIIPWPFDVPMKEFINPVTGKIDVSKVDPKVLEFVGARIPNQGFSSQLPIKVVGFLPATMKDMIIIPDGITQQMGSDFDIDKLYTYISNYTITGNGALKALDYSLDSIESLNKSQLQNLYKDIHWNILTNPEVIKRVVQPLDKQDLVNETEKILKVSKAGSDPNSINPLLWVNQINIFSSQKDAKNLVGNSSLYTTFNSLIQNLNIKLSEEFKESGGNINLFGLDLEYLSNPKGVVSKTAYEGEERTVSDNLIIFQNAFLDNAKNPIAGKLGINDVTFGPLAILTMLKDVNGNSLNMSYLSRFIAQPVIKEYVEAVKTANSGLSTEFINEQEIRDSILAKYLSGAPLKTVTLTDEDLLDMLKPSVEKSEEYYNKQANIINTFFKLEKIAELIADVQSSTNVDSKGTPKGFIEIVDKKDKLNNAIFGSSILTGLNEIIYNPNESTTEVGTAISYGLDLPIRVFKNQLPFIQDWYISTQNSIQKALGKARLSTQLKKDIWKGFRSYVFSNPSLLLFEGNITSERSRLLKGNNSLAHRLESFKKNPLYANNLLIQRLYYELNNEEIHKVLYRASTDEATEEKEITTAFLSLLTGTAEEQSFAKDLIAYNYLTGGNQTAVGFAKYIPVQYLFTTNYPTIDSLDYQSINKEAFIRQFVQNNYTQAKKVSSSVLSKYFKDDGGILTIKKFEGNPLVNADGELAYKYIHLQASTENNVHLLYEADYNTNQYVRIPLAGTYKVGFEEYDFTKDTVVSIIESNNRGAKVINPQIQVPIKNSTIITNTLPSLSIEEYAKDIFSSYDKKGLMTAVSKISDTTKDPSLKVVSELILGSEILIDDNIKVSFDLVENKRGTLNYNLVNNKAANFKIAFNTNAEAKWAKASGITPTESFDETVIHETLHAMTVGFLDFYEKNPNSPLFAASPRLKELADNLNSVYEQAKEEFNKLSELDRKSPKNVSLMEAFKRNDTKEFLVRVLTDKNVQSFLSGIKNKNKSLFTEIIDSIKQLFLEIGKLLNISTEQLDNSLFREAFLTSGALIRNLEKIKSDKIEQTTAEKNTQKTTIYKYYGANYEIILDSDGKGVDVVGYKGKNVDKQKLLDKYNENPNVDPQNGKPFTTSKINVSNEETEGRLELGSIKLNKQQQEAYDKIIEFFNESGKNSRDTYTLQGYAGTGKTTMTRFLVEYMENNNIRFLLASPTHRAKEVLQDNIENVTAVKAVTLAKALGLQPGIELDDFSLGNKMFVQKLTDKFPVNGVIIIDEASMINDELYDFILKTADLRGTKVLFIGDEAQLKPVKQNEISKPFRRNKDISKLTQIMRTKGDNPMPAEVLQPIRNNSTSKTDQFESITRLNSKGEGIEFTKDRASFIEEAMQKFESKEFNKDLFYVRLLAYTNKAVKTLNQQVRTRLFGRGIADFVTGELMLMYENRFFNVGDWILPNGMDISVQNVEETTSKYANGKAYNLTLVSAKKREYLINVVASNFPTKEYLQKLTELKDKALLSRSAYDWSNYYKYDEMLFTTENIYVYDDKIYNSDEEIIKVLKAENPKDTADQIKIKAGKLKVKDKLFDYGYAHTVHKSQGGTYKYAYVDKDDIDMMLSFPNPDIKLWNQLKYVGFSRSAVKTVVLSQKTKEGKNLYSEGIEVDTESLGITVVEFMKELSKEERELFRNLVTSGIITPKCD